MSPDKYRATHALLTAWETVEAPDCPDVSRSLGRAAEVCVESNARMLANDLGIHQPHVLRARVGYAVRLGRQAVVALLQVRSR